MKLFRSIGHQHLDGHKDLTNHSEIIDLAKTNKEAVKKVYFPTMSPNGKPIDFVVKAGDHVKIGTRIASRTDFNVPIYSSVSGVVLEDEMIYSAQVGRPIKHIVIENDYKDEFDEPLKVVNDSSTKDEILEAITNAGMVGMGGAGFPTYIKYANTKGIETILVNAVECEPYITADYAFSKQNADMLFKTVAYLVKYAEAKEGIIAIKVHKDEQKQVLEKANTYSNIRIVEVNDLYPMGWERTLIKTVLNKTYDKLPAEANTIISNVATVINLGNALFNGRPVYQRIVTVSGNGFNNNSNFLVPIGINNNELVKAVGGLVEGDVDLLPGGPMCGKAVNTDNFPLVMSQGALTCLKHVTYHVDPCLRCGNCTYHCPNYLQPVELKNAFDRKDFDRLEKLNLMSCVECGLCSYVCPSHIELTDTIKKAKLVYKLKKK